METLFVRGSTFGVIYGGYRYSHRSRVCRLQQEKERYPGTNNKPGGMPWHSSPQELLSFTASHSSRDSVVASAVYVSYRGVPQHPAHNLVKQGCSQLTRDHLPLKALQENEIVDQLVIQLSCSCREVFIVCDRKICRFVFDE